MDYRELKFYQKAQEVVKGVNIEIKNWPKTMQSVEISQQLFRAAVSVGSNIAEGHGRHEGREYIHFLTISQGSANEIDHWLNTALICGIGSGNEIRELLALNNETRKMLTATLNTLTSHLSVKTVREESPIPYSPSPSSPDNESELS